LASFKILDCRVIFILKQTLWPQIPFSTFHPTQRPSNSSQQSTKTLQSNSKTQLTYHPPSPSITVQLAKLVLENGQEITGENTISEFLGESHEKLNWTPELRAETHEWLSRSTKFTTNPEEVYVPPLQ
jgi:LAS superfamily LD-carboxypeptidase LdcB